MTTKLRAADPEQVKKNNAALKKGSGAIIGAMIAATLALEGGYVFHKADPGGETNHGITKQVAVNAGYTAPMKQLPVEVAKSIYYQQYVVDLGYDKLVDSNAPVIAELYDTTVNMGPARPMRFLQKSLNKVCNTTLLVNGRMSLDVQISFQNCSESLGPVNFCLRMLNELDAQQRAEYDRLVRVNPKLKVFHRGWVNHRIGNVPRSSCKVTYAGV